MIKNGLPSPVIIVVMCFGRRTKLFKQSVFHKKKIELLLYICYKTVWNCKSENIILVSNQQASI